jgi:hypothetical protein
MEQPFNRRRARRRAVMWPAVIKQGERSWSCTIVNVSTVGARLNLIGAVAPKSRVLLMCDRFGALEANMMWRDGMYAGLKFLAPPHEIETVLGPLVPGLGRDEPAQPPRRLFGRLPRRHPGPG